METESHKERIVTPGKTLLVGVGGAGIHVLDALSQHAEEFPPMIAVDTDGQSLEASLAPKRIQIGAGVSEGMSTGGDPNLGRRAANEDYVKFRELFVDADLVILVAGLGGGVGTGAVPVIAQTAKDEGALVMTLATMPFPFEGEERAATAEKALQNLVPACHAVIRMPNRFLMAEANPDQPISEAFAEAATYLGEGLRIIWKLLGRRGLIQLDFMGLRNLLDHAGGVCTMVTVEASGKNKARLALNRLLSHPLVKEQDVWSDAGGILIGLLGGDDLSFKDVQEFMEGVTGELHSNARRLTGVGIDSDIKNKLIATVLVGSKPSEPGAGEPPQPETSPETKEPTGKKRPAHLKAPQQGQLSLDADKTGRGRFKNVEPTLHEGEDLDTPTFLRRGMKLRR